MKVTILTQSSLQIECNPYQIPMTFFTELAQKKFTIWMEKEKTPSSQSYLEKEKQLQLSTFLTSNYPTKL